MGTAQLPRTGAKTAGAARVRLRVAMAAPSRWLGCQFHRAIWRKKKTRTLTNASETKVPQLVGMETKFLSHPTAGGLSRTGFRHNWRGMLDTFIGNGDMEQP